MKKLITICLLIATAFTTNAQDGKPTKEQTVEYLKSVLLNVEGGQYKNPNTKSGVLFSLSEITLDGCLLKMKYRSQEKQIGEKFPASFGKDFQEIDFSIVESFKFIFEETSGNWKNYNDNLYLNYDEKKSKNNGIVGFYCKPEDKEKVLKALNHLRKLCGAPEPISFD